MCIRDRSTWGVLMDPKLSTLRNIYKTILRVGITGPTTAGKSTLVKSLAARYKCRVIHQDHFVNAHHVINNLNYNWECPDAVDHDRFERTLCRKYEEEMRKGRDSVDIFVAEGYMLFHNPIVASFFDVKIWLDLKYEDIYKRRQWTRPVPQWYFDDFIIKEHFAYRKRVEQHTPDIIFLDATLPQEEIVDKVVEIIEGTKPKIPREGNAFING
eukprot:TRINITY_DN11005_c0_g1_i1.p1 TRINITY_DN11005_c0_g1~~TRINITY_DN11005_c0_g1_i1.p1  ORF type:complete len:232 (-),score=26.61 TRINITY_DN11005_c0_g1_i1:265-903(-)